MVMRLTIWILAGTLFAATSWSQEPTTGSGAAHPGTRAMVSLLKKIERDRQNAKNSLANTLRAEALVDVLERTEEVGERLRVQFEMASELLNAGYYEQSQKAFLGAFSTLYQNRSVVEEGSLLEAWQRLGIAHLREAEVALSTRSESPETAIFPIQPEVAEKFPGAARAAIEIFGSLLKEFPADLGTMYLLNVAHMLNGSFPSSVPEEYLLPVEESQVEFTRYLNTASQWNADIDGLAGGVVLEDLDGDGDLDLMVSSHSLNEPIRLLLNDGGGRFEDVTDSCGLMGLGGGIDLVHADYDNDGDQDVFVVRGGNAVEGFGDTPNSLLRNEGNGIFVDVTIEAGVFNRRPSRSAAWADFNGDGNLDLLIGNGSSPTLDPERQGVPPGPLGCELYLNLGGGKFREIAEEVGLVGRGNFAGVAIGDFDNDGDPDVFLSNEGGANRLYLNTKTSDEISFRLEDIANSAGVIGPDQSLVTWWFDYNNDGWLDLFVGGYSSKRLAGSAIARDAAIDLWDLPKEAERLWLYENDGRGRFSDVSNARGLDRVVYARGGGFGDLDSDGFLDFYLSTGGVEFSSIIPNRMFRNRGGESFEDITAHGGFGHLGRGASVAFGDVDNDGDTDVYTVLGGYAEADRTKNALFENPGHGNQWIQVQLLGVSVSKDAIGARIELIVDTESGSRSLLRTVDSGGSGGSASYRQTIGLGKATAIREIRVRWPGDTAQISYGAAPMDRAIEIEQGRGGFRVLD